MFYWNESSENSAVGVEREMLDTSVALILVSMYAIHLAKTKHEIYAVSRQLTAVIHLLAHAVELRISSHSTMFYYIAFR